MFVFWFGSDYHAALFFVVSRLTSQYIWLFRFLFHGCYGSSMLFFFVSFVRLNSFLMLQISVIMMISIQLEMSRFHLNILFHHRLTSPRGFHHVTRFSALT